MSKPKTKLSSGLKDMAEKAGANPDEFAMVNIGVRYADMRKFIAHLALIGIDVQMPPKVEAMVKFYEEGNKQEESH